MPHSPPVRHPSPTGDTMNDTSVTSAWSDEGLDLSQQLAESIFAGPDLDSDGEELVSGRLYITQSILKGPFCDPMILFFMT